MAKSGCSAVSPRTSAVGQIADLRGAMSAFPPIASASPPGADSPGGVAEGLLLTHSGHQTIDSSTRIHLMPSPSHGVIDSWPLSSTCLAAPAASATRRT